MIDLLPFQTTDSVAYSLVEVCLDKGVTEREMARNEKPWEILQESRRVSKGAAQESGG